MFYITITGNNAYPEQEEDNKGKRVTLIVSLYQLVFCWVDYRNVDNASSRDKQKSYKEFKYFFS